MDEHALNGLMVRLQQRWPRGLSSSEWLKVADFRESHWVRFHNLPQSKRWPSNEQEFAEVLRRQNALLAELDPGKSIVIITAEWSNTPSPAGQESSKRSQLAPDARYWQTFLENPEEQDEKFHSYRHVYVSRHTWTSGAVDELLLAVADEQLGGVLITTENLEWFFCPYDGGVDVFLHNKPARDALKERHKDWLSDTASGL